MPSLPRRVVTRALPRVRTDRRMAHPDSGLPLRALEVADVDLDTSTVSVWSPVTPHETEPEGVHALVWFHGTPLGEVTVLGRPVDVLPGLVEQARSRLLFPRWQHLLHDALSTPGGLPLAQEGGLDAVGHPPEPDRPAPSVTVAVCTRDRPDALRSCLAAVTALRTPVLEVLVVDNASADGRTRDVAAEFPSVRYVWEPRRGLDWARNRALHEARGDVIAYTDDDALVHPDWVAGLLRAFQDEPTAVGVTGLVVPRELATSAQVLFELIGGFGRGYRRLWFSAAVASGESAARSFGGSGGAGTGANMAFRRQRLVELGGFDLALDVGTPSGGGGDLEMFFRVVAAGDLLVYEPSAVVRHQHRPDFAALLRQMRGHGTGSYSYFMGAGLEYGPRQAGDFRRLALWWALRHHLRGQLVALAAPGVVPYSMRSAELRGAWDAISRSYYRQAQRQARQEQSIHGGPVVGEPVRSPGVPASTRAADPVVDVELMSPGPVEAAPPAPARPGRRVRVQVLRRGEPQHVFVAWPQGSSLSPTRLRWELVDQLGPALLAAGASLDGWTGTRLGAEPLPARRDEGSPPLTARHRQQLEQDLLGRRETRAEQPPGRDGSVTVLLCTRDRPDHLRTVLSCLSAQRTQREVQVLLVDNSADPGTTTRLARDHPGVEVLHEPRPGLSHARNRALTHVRGEVLVFVDDDCVPPADWLDRLLAPFDDPTVAMVTGNVFPAELASLESQLFEDYGGLGRGPHRATYEPEWLLRHDRAVPTWLIGATANAAVRTDWVRKLGPFVEHLGAGTPAGVGEDTEYFYRVLHAGGRIQYEPKAWVRHAHRTDREGLEHQLEAYSAGHVAYHLEVAARYRDLRGVRRVVLGLPRALLSRSRSIRRGDDDFPAELVRAQVRGHLRGPSAWVRSRQTTR